MPPTDSLPTQFDDERVAELWDIYVEVHNRLTMFVVELSDWLDTIEDSNEALKESIERFRYAETHKDPPELEEGSDLVLVPMRLDDITASRVMYERILGVKTRYRDTIAEMAVLHLVAAFEAFVADLLEWVLTKRPELLKASQKKISFAEVAALDPKIHLLAELAAREVRSWQFKTFREQAAILQSRFGATLYGPKHDSDPTESIIEVFARRNLLLHNRGVVNAQYLELVPGAAAGTGERLVTDHEYWRIRSRQLSDAANHLAHFMTDRHLQPAG